MKEVQVRIHDMSSTLHPANAYALVLEEVYGSRKLPIIIGPIEAHSIKVAIKNYHSPRPLTHDLLLNLTHQFSINLKKVLIHDVKDGVFYSSLFFEQGEKEVVLDARTSDAVAIALRCGRPLYTTEALMESEHLHEEGDGAFSISINMVDVSLLKEELEKAIKNENYEQASQLRDEIARRERGINEEK
ncbi:MAG: bifunctional nuclease domain-containing protein [Phocaeicola sp.]